jgi:ribosomal protein S18 acetylase RimI-like enzyme
MERILTVGRAGSQPTVVEDSPDRSLAVGAARRENAPSRQGTGMGWTLTIRPFEYRDEAAVTTLWREAFPDDPPRNEPSRVIRRKLSVHPELFLVGELDGRVVAAVVGGWDGFRGWINHLAVSAAARRRGFGRAMVAALEARLANLGCPKVNLQVRATNAQVVAFYERLGYDVEDRVSLGKLLD